MSYIPLLSQEHWPLKPIDSTLFEHFSYKFDESLRPNINVIEMFQNAMSSNLNFAQLWNEYWEKIPKNGVCLSPVSFPETQFDAHCSFGNYRQYLKRQVFNSQSEEERADLQREYISQRTEAYEIAKQGEALRLKCDVSEVVPTLPIFPLGPEEGQSKLVDLPADIFWRIMQKLESLEIFRITLVCKKWKEYVYRSGIALKRAEHALTTHLITFKDWMNPTYAESVQADHKPTQYYFESPKRVLMRQKFLSHYLNANRWLTKWCCEVSNNMEVLVMEWPLSHSRLISLLAMTPKLKVLILATSLSYSYQHYVEHGPLVNIDLSNLEAFVVEAIAQSQTKCLVLSILTDSPSLSLLQCSIDAENWTAITSRRPAESIFENIVALHLESLTSSVLQDLANLDLHRLKYLRLDDLDRFERGILQTVLEVVVRDAFHQLLSRLKQIEVLIIAPSIGLINSSIQLLIELKLCLKFALLWELYVPIASEEDDNLYVEGDLLIEESTLLEYQEILRDKVREPNYSKITVYQSTIEEQKCYKDDVVTLNILKSSDDDQLLPYPARPAFALSDPVMRQRLGFNF